MTRGRLAALVALGLALATLLLDWTVGTLDVLAISRVDDLARMRSAMRELDDGALAFAPGVDLRLGRGRYRVTTGPLGERTGPTAAAVPEGGAALRILVLGGGAAFGAGVDDDRSFARRLEQARATDGRPCVVVNAAQPFFDVADAAALAEHWIPRVRPELVLLCLPAAGGAPDALLRAVAARSSEPAPWWGRVLPALWRFGQRASGGLERKAPPTPGEAERAAAIAAADGLARGAGARLVVVELGGSGVAAATAERIDAAPSARERAAAFFVDAEAGWPSAFGHARIAARIAAALTDIGLLVRQEDSESSR